MKIFLIIFISLLSLSNSLKAQNLRKLEEMNDNLRRSEQIKKQLLINRFHLHDDFFYESRKKLLRELKLSDFGKDSLVFVEIYSYESLGYTGTVCKSGDIDCISIYIKRGAESKMEYKDGTLTQYIVDEIKKRGIDDILERGRKSTIYPVFYIFITIATRQGKDYDIKSYSTQLF
jgi:hypothetical protein